VEGPGNLWEKIKGFVAERKLMDIILLGRDQEMHRMRGNKTIQKHHRRKRNLVMFL